MKKDNHEAKLAKYDLEIVREPGARFELPLQAGGTDFITSSDVQRLALVRNGVEEVLAPVTAHSFQVVGELPDGRPIVIAKIGASRRLVNPDTLDFCKLKPFDEDARRKIELEVLSTKSFLLDSILEIDLSWSESVDASACEKRAKETGETEHWHQQKYRKTKDLWADNIGQVGPELSRYVANIPHFSGETIRHVHGNVFRVVGHRFKRHVFVPELFEESAPSALPTMVRYREKVRSLLGQ